jgi:hypothetical protein
MIFQEIDNLPLKPKHKKYLKRVYLLGYDVGYFSHNEKSDWIRDARRSIMIFAKKNKIKNEVINYYKKGRKEGKLKAKADFDDLAARKGRYVQPDIDEEFNIERPYRYVYTGLPQCLMGTRTISLPQWTNLTPQLSNIPVKKYSETRKAYYD